jgi:hypothetical protein
MATVSAPLNAEPADPKGRAEHNLPPKSYVDAIVEGEDTPTTTTGRFSSRASSATAVDSNEANKQQLDEDKIIEEKRVGNNGSRLISVKPDGSHEESLKHNNETAPREERRSRGGRPRPNPRTAPLESGRKAGAGWQRSAYA